MCLFPTCRPLLTYTEHKCLGSSACFCLWYGFLRVSVYDMEIHIYTDSGYVCIDMDLCVCLFMIWKPPYHKQKHDFSPMNIDPFSFFFIYWVLSTYTCLFSCRVLSVYIRLFSYIYPSLFIYISVSFPIHKSLLLYFSFSCTYVLFHVYRSLFIYTEGVGLDPVHRSLFICIGLFIYIYKSLSIHIGLLSYIHRSLFIYT